MKHLFGKPSVRFARILAQIKLEWVRHLNKLLDIYQLQNIKYAKNICAIIGGTFKTAFTPTFSSIKTCVFFLSEKSIVNRNFWWTHCICFDNIHYCLKSRLFSFKPSWEKGIFYLIRADQIGLLLWIVKPPFMYWLVKRENKL